MRFNIPIVSGFILAVTGGAIAAPVDENSVSGEKLAARAVWGSQLYGCTGRNFGGHCENTPAGNTGVCTSTTGMFRNNLISVRAVRYGAFLYEGENCTGASLWVDTEGWSNIGAAMYRSWYTPTPCLPPQCG